MPFNIEDYIQIGAGGISFLLIIFMMYGGFFKLFPAINRLNEQNAKYNEYVRIMVNQSEQDSARALDIFNRAMNTNSLHLEEIRKTNDNMSKILEVLNESQKGVTKLLDQQNGRSLEIDKKMTLLIDRTIRTES